MLNLEKPWLFAVSMTVIGVLIFGLIETVLFDGDLLSAVIQGFAAGLAFALVYLYSQRNDSDA